jgi:hypothetical protein
VTFIHADNQKPGELAEPSRAAALEKLEQAVLATNHAKATRELAI